MGAPLLRLFPELRDASLGHRLGKEPLQAGGEVCRNYSGRRRPKL